ncbi:MAG: adenosylcobinamide-GDP ribazoletransferase [Firmicutes bacterium]|nr:adenosylcobinamide-GDP ribazoletransferase [Bacillota bacterium]
MKYITAFFMTWGNFCTLPCPWKLWDGKYKSIMLGFLPSIGLIIGTIWGAVSLLLPLCQIPDKVLAFVLTFVLFALCGFMHLDGFMDCSDAIMSRKPLEDRQRILKDSHTGAFAVVSVVFLILAYYSCISSAAASHLIDPVCLTLICIVSRSFSGMEVLASRAMGTSQYVEMESQEKATKREGIILIVIQLALFIAAGFLLTSDTLMLAAVCGAVAATTLLAISYGKKQLGGMNGDIAGYGIVWGELAGVLVLAFY